MTREEAITVFKAFMENPLFSDIHKATFNIAIHDIKQHHDWDINNLMLVPKTEWEQEPILDKIRSEIKSKIIKKPNLDFKTWERERNEALLEVLGILDKYKGESENKE